MRKFAAILLLSSLVTGCTSPAGETGTGDQNVYFCGAENKIIEDNIAWFDDGKGRFRAGGHQVASPVFEGKSAVKLDPEQPYGMPMTFTDVEVGNYFEASVWIKEPVGPATLIAGVSGRSNYTLNTQAVNRVETKGEWTKYFLSFGVETPIDSLTFYCFSANEVAYFDNLEIARYAQRPAITADSADVLRIFIPDSGMTALDEYKDKAMQQEIISSDLKEYVNGFIVEKGDSIPIELRLKGDWTDHLEYGKASYRIKSERPYRDLTSFSIQHPGTRNFMHEWYIHRLCDMEDLLSTTYDFLPVEINGINQGVYALEEHFDDALLETRRRPEGPIIKMDESGFWALLASGKKDMLEGSYPYFESSMITTFKEGKTAKSERMSNQFNSAATLLYLFKNLYPNPEHLFDLEQTAKFYALMDLANVTHALAWHNRRYYYNPITAKLELVGFDMIPAILPMNHVMANRKFELVNTPSEDESALDYYLFANAEFFAHYKNYLHKFSSKNYLDSTFALLENEIAEREKILDAEFPGYKLDRDFYYEKVDFNNTNAQQLDSSWNEYTAKVRKQQRPTLIAPNYPEPASGFFLEEVSVNIYRNETDSAQYELEFENYHLSGVTITGYSTKENPTVMAFSRVIRLERYDGLKPAASEKIMLPAKATKVYFTVDNIPNVVQDKKVFDWPKPSSTHPRIELAKSPGTNNAIFKKDGNALVIRAGQHELKQLVYVPENYAVRIEAGAEINITNKGGLIFNGDVSMIGTAEAPVRITSTDSTSQGIAILDANEVIIRYTELSNQDALNYNGWTLNGALTIYNANVSISDLSIKNALADDALNIVRGDFEIDNLTVIDARKDAFDCDYADGSIIHSAFVNTPNDCIDSTGSTIHTEDITINNSSLEGGNAGDFDAMRIENEIKLTVPEDITVAVWEYLKTRYDNETMYLKDIDSTFNSKVAEDLFTDQYFDNDAFDVLRTQNGIRHRSRIVLTDSTNRKNGRQLMQLKVNNISTNILNRAEYKYPIRYYEPAEEELDKHPFLRNVQRKYRDDIVDRLNELGAQAMDMHPTILLHQLRQRVYLFRGLDPFATMTLDHVTAFWDNDTAYFTELELELNEINYTEGDSVSRMEMEQINDDIKGDILKQFPSIFQDQTPKYNKAAKLFDLQTGTSSSSAEVTGSKPYVLYLLLGTCLLLVVLVAFASLQKKKGNS